MKTEEFEDIILKNAFFEIERTLGAKAEEYARGDRLSNFKIAATFTGISPEKVLFIWVMKHIEALKSFVNDLDEGQNQPLARWIEKTRDITNYMILLEALNIERFQNEQGKDKP